MAVLFHSPFNFEYWSPRRAQLWLRMSARAQGCCSARRCGRLLPRGGLSRAYPGVSTVGTTCTASCWPLKASSWSTATPRLQIGGIEKRPVFFVLEFLASSLIVGECVSLWLLGLERSSSCKKSHSQITTNFIEYIRTLNESNSF
ncbi:hypothetical protein VPH35_052308 [Triticum aestivum]